MLLLISCVQELDETGVYVQVVVQVYVGVLLLQAVVLVLVRVLVGYGSDSPVWLEWACAVVVVLWVQVVVQVVLQVAVS